MCLLLYFINPDARDDEFFLILVDIRDEMYNRPTSHAHFWNNFPDVVGGRDLERGKEGGTWFAVSKTGKIAALLNVLQPDDEIAPNKKGRGFLVTDYVSGDEDCYEYLHKVSSEKDDYNGFTLVTLDIGSKESPKAAYFTNISSSVPKVINSTIIGYHAFGNSTSIDDPWPKVITAKERFQTIVRCNRKVRFKERLKESLIGLTNDRTRHTLDENMKKQGRGKTPEFLDKLSSVFVHMPEINYGSRSQTIVLVEGSGKVDYIEKHRTVLSTWKFREFTFQLNSWEKAGMKPSGEGPSS